MNNILTDEERLFLEKHEQQKIKHRASQQAYRTQHQEQIRDYNKRYFEERKKKLNEINEKLLKPASIPTQINIPEIIQPEKIDKRTRKGKKNATHQDIVPSYQTRKDPLSYTSMNDYLNKANKINQIFKNRNLPQPVQAELKKLLNDNQNINQDLILSEMDYLNEDINTTIEKLREVYTNDNTFKSYTNVLSVIASHFKNFNHIYQPLTKIGKFINQKVQEKREQNELDEKDEGKIINIDKDEIMDNLEKLKRIEDRVIYALYMLFPARRLDYRNMKITTETDETKLNHINYLIVSNPLKFIFNDYKTDRIYGKQSFPVPADLGQILNQYIMMKGLKSGDYLFSLLRNKKEAIAESNFSNKIMSVFKKIYGIPITDRFLRMSWATHINNSNLSQAEIKKLTLMMAHSILESGKYRKLLKNKKMIIKSI